MASGSERDRLRRRAAGIGLTLGLALCALGLPRQAARARVTTSPQRALRVLIVGNSYVRFNVLPHLLSRLSASVKSGPRLAVDAEARNGYSLRMHLRAGQALIKIRSGHYDAVVLQSHSMSAVDHPAELAEDAARFKREIDATGARTLLYETWPRQPGARLYRKHPFVHSYEQMAGQLEATYSGLALQLGAQLAPVGSAFERSFAEQPELGLWGPDGSHPTLAGSFLAACVLYGAIASEDPREASYVPINMKSDRADSLKAVAARTLSGERGQALEALADDVMRDPSGAANQRQAPVPASAPERAEPEPESAVPVDF